MQKQYGTFGTPAELDYAVKNPEEYIKQREKVIAEEQAAAYSVEETQRMLDGEDPDSDDI